MINIKIEGYESISRKRRKRKKIAISILAIFFCLTAIFLLAVPALIMGDMVNKHVDFKEVHSAEEFGLTSETLTLITEDELNVVAYEVNVESPKAIVIFLSGIHNPSVTSFFGHAKMLKENGYGSILLEMRAHGESEGDVISLGYKEYLDTKAVVGYIEDKQQDIPIVVYGLSMGGATAINSIGEIDEIDALISMSAYSSWEDVFYDNMLSSGAPKLYADIQKPFVKIYSVFKYGLKSFNISPMNEIKKLGERPALIIHSRADSQVSYRNFERIMENAPYHVKSWVKEGDFHFILADDNYFFNPMDDEEYSGRIINFLDSNFGG